LLGGLRAASQTVSCEVTKGLSLIGLIEIYGTLRIDQMVWWQAQNAWGLFVQPTAFVLFFVASVAESKRLPFDLPEGKSELVAGYLTEYSGLKFAMFYFSEYVSLATSSALLVALFFGGWSIPFVDRDGLRVIIGGTEWLSVALPQIVVVSLGVGAFVGKWLFLCWIQLLIRWSLPRFRYDQLMTLGWQKLVPLSLVNIVVTATIVMTIESLGGATTDKALTLLGQLTESVSVVIGLVGFVVLGLFLMKPVRYEKLVASSSASSPVASTGAVSGGTGV
jgi:NADH-quinone oxidoreductase subunit H